MKKSGNTSLLTVDNGDVGAVRHGNGVVSSRTEDVSTRRSALLGTIVPQFTNVILVALNCVINLPV